MQSTSYFELYAPQSVALIIIMTGFYVNATENRSHYYFFTIPSRVPRRPELLIY